MRACMSSRVVGGWGGGGCGGAGAARDAASGRRNTTKLLQKSTQKKGTSVSYCATANSISTRSSRKKE